MFQAVFVACTYDIASAIQFYRDIVDKDLHLEPSRSCRLVSTLDCDEMLLYFDAQALGPCYDVSCLDEAFLVALQNINFSETPEMMMLFA